MLQKVKVASYSVMKGEIKPSSVYNKAKLQLSITIILRSLKSVRKV